MPLTKDSSVVTTYILNLIDANKVALGLTRVYRGEQNLIPEYPAVTVRSGPKRRGIATTRQYEIELKVVLLVMLGKVGEVEMSELEVEQLAETIESLLHSDRTLGDTPDNLVYHSFVQAIDPGVRVVESANIRTTRITWLGQSREIFS